MINRVISDRLKLLNNNGIESSRLELKILISHIKKIPLQEISLSSTLNEQELTTLDKFIQMRLAHCPVDKIIGEKGFYKYDFVVDCNVLSPRSDTEILVEKAIDILKDKKQAKVLELGVGSGCIILSILADLPQVTGVGIDISPKALDVAKTNAKRLDISADRLVLIQASWFDCDILDSLKKYGSYDLIVSNPPYIPSKEIPLLDEEVKKYDPLLALDGGVDGLRDYDQILAISEKILCPNGSILLEADNTKQLEKIAENASLYHFNNHEILKDLCMNDRCILLNK